MQERLPEKLLGLLETDQSLQRMDSPEIGLRVERLASRRDSGDSGDFQGAISLSEDRTLQVERLAPETSNRRINCPERHRVERLVSAKRVQAGLADRTPSKL